ncbi:hypothetical protein DSCO28_30350 [Desulfosarcina ovata subsp. sediminis]|uniref:Toprim domain-containing protein n=1 Tax=Desulfosarcina ovata subsp. sediminis TaxID=885957 RepID=A0A5K7ZQE0_9BACT|nr:AAA family ATPase [Desulfosarcina ovata]BBO82469.1 hypothetical protein DSCO28_30350 [Desulfosarcina ovata subsp. sediminis]
MATETESAFQNAIAEHGPAPAEIVADGNLHRYDIDKPGDKAGWYALHLDGVPAGVFGNWRTGVTTTWCSKQPHEMTEAEKAENRRRIEDARRQREEGKAKSQARAKTKAVDMLAMAEPSPTDHPYLVMKGVAPAGLKVLNGNLLVPVVDGAGVVCSLQTISPDGEKRFLTGGRIKGCSYTIPGNGDLYIGEGFATMASVHAATGVTCICAFNAGNLDAVVKTVRGKNPTAPITVCGDDDRWTDGNPGRTKATAAAEKYHCRVVFPEFSSLDTRPTDFNDLAVEDGPAEVKRQIEAHEKKRPSFKLIHIGAIDIKPPDFLIRPFLERDSLAEIFGDPGCGKSFIGVNMACCVGTGTPFHGLSVKQCPVVYIAGEGQSGIGRRFMAWSIRNGVAIHEAPILVSTAPASFCDDGQVDDVIESIDLSGIDRPGLIVVDTVARNFGSGDENSTADMTKFVAACDNLRERYRATILLIHHSGHADKSRARGAMALKGALDADYRLEKDIHGVVRLECKKMKDGEIPQPMAFKIRSVELPLVDEDGNPVTSAVLDRIDYEPPAQATSAGKGKNQTTAIAQLKDLIAGRDDKKAPLHEWRDACCQYMDRNAFYRVKKALTASGEITEDGFYAVVNTASSSSPIYIGG